MNLNYFNIPVFFLSIVLSTGAISEVRDNKEYYLDGLKSYASHQYVDAETLFAESTGYKARIGRAFSNYKLNNLNKARAFFKQSVLLAKLDSERFLSLYNAAVCSFILADYESAYQLFIDSKKYNTDNLNALNFIKLSKYLAALVRAQLAREKAPSNKMQSSEGKRTISAVDFVFDDDINLRIEDSEGSDSITINQQQLYISDKALIKSLVDAGVESITVNNSKHEERSYSSVDRNILYEFSELEKVTVTPSSSTSDLWKRIFEIEQGFPASLDEAEKIPGVRSW